MLGGRFDEMGDEMGDGTGRGPEFARRRRNRRRAHSFGGGFEQSGFGRGGMGVGPAGFGRGGLNGGLGLDGGFGDEEDDPGLEMDGGLGMGSSGRYGYGDLGEGMGQWGAQGLGKGQLGIGPGKRRMRRDRPPTRRRRGMEVDPLGDGLFMSGGNGFGDLGGRADGGENSWEDVDDEPEILQNPMLASDQRAGRKSRSRHNSQQPTSSQPPPLQHQATSHPNVPNLGQRQTAPHSSQPPLSRRFSGQPSPMQQSQMPPGFTYPPPPQGPSPGIVLQPPTGESFPDENFQRDTLRRAMEQGPGPG